MLLGPNRGRYFLLTGQKIHAEEARQLGIVGEVLPGDQVLARAQEIAAGLAQLNPILLRNTRHALVRPLRRAMADDLHTGLALEAIASMSAGSGTGPRRRRDREPVRRRRPWAPGRRRRGQALGGSPAQGDVAWAAHLTTGPRWLGPVRRG